MKTGKDNDINELRQDLTAIRQELREEYFIKERRRTCAAKKVFMWK